jgi:dienelactone hydrolase
MLSALATLAVVVAILGVGPNATGLPSTGRGAASKERALGIYETTWVDTSRPTARNGAAPELPSRTLRTVYVYPGKGTASATPIAGAAPDKAGGPYPLIVFAHGQGATPELHMDQIAGLAARGFVVAAPAFPLTNADAIGGPNGADEKNQPADVSFVITETLKAAKGTEGPLAGLVNPKEIAVGGHSGGAITTMGFTNTCCEDPRVKALFVWAGNHPEFDGRYDYTHTPPIIFVHGTKDSFLPYNEMVDSFNAITAPKAFLTMVGEDHGSWATNTDNSFNMVVSTTVDFLNTYLRDDTAAKARIAKGDNSADYKLLADLGTGKATKLKKLPTPKLDRKATVTPSTGLTDGQPVTVAWTGYTPGQVVNIVQCSGTTATACEVGRGKILTPDPTGDGSTTLTVYAGPIGDGQCGPGIDTCNIVINDAGLSDPGANVRIPISFG